MFVVLSFFSWALGGGEAWQSMILFWGMPHVPKVSVMGQSNDYFFIIIIIIILVHTLTNE
jgi:hypothetical protein